MQTTTTITDNENRIINQVANKYSYINSQYLKEDIKQELYLKMLEMKQPGKSLGGGYEFEGKTEQVKENHKSRHTWTSLENRVKDLARTQICRPDTSDYALGYVEFFDELGENEDFSTEAKEYDKVAEVKALMMEYSSWIKDPEESTFIEQLVKPSESIINKWKQEYKKEFDVDTYIPYSVIGRLMNLSASKYFKFVDKLVLFLKQEGY